VINVSYESRQTFKFNGTHTAIPFLKAKKLGGKKELDSSHQSSLDLSICSNILQSDEDIAIGRKEVLEFGLGMGMTLYEHQVVSD